MSNKLEPEDLGNGFKLSFQLHTPTNQIRAVIKDASGAILFRGPTQENTDLGIAVTRRMATMDFLCRKEPEPNGEYDDGADFDEEGDEEDEE